MHWKRRWQPTPVFLPGESQGQRSLVGCRLWGHTESEKTKVTQQQQQRVFEDHSPWTSRVPPLGTEALTAFCSGVAF